MDDPDPWGHAGGVDDAWQRRLVAAKAAHLRLLGRADTSTAWAVGGLDIVVTGVLSNSLNGVAGTAAQLTPGTVARALRLVAGRGVPATWLVTDDAVPAEPLPVLTAAGCRPELEGWVRGGRVDDVLARLADLSSSAAEVAPVQRGAQVADWLDVAAEVWGDALDDPPGERNLRGLLVHELGTAIDGPWPHWVAHDAAGRAVGNASAVLDPASRTVLVEHLNTVPGERRRGVASSLLRAVLEEARHRGCSDVVLEPSPAGAAFYDAVGMSGVRTVVPREYDLPTVDPG